MSDTPSKTTMHPFERAQLGVAPFKFVGCVENVFQAAPGEPIRAGGSCDYCGNGIRYEMHIEGADGKKFKVGSDCVMRLNRSDNAKRDPVVVAVNDARRKVTRDARHKREAAQIETLTEKFEKHYGWIEAYQIPRGGWRSDGATQSAAASVDWFLENAGNAGKIKRLKWASWLIDSMLVMGGTPSDALRRPTTAPETATVFAMGRSAKYDCRDMARDLMYSEFGHSRYHEWPEDAIARYVEFAVETYCTSAEIKVTPEDLEEIRSLVPWN